MLSKSSLFDAKPIDSSKYSWSVFERILSQRVILNEDIKAIEQIANASVQRRSSAKSRVREKLFAIENTKPVYELKKITEAYQNHPACKPSSQRKNIPNEIKSQLFSFFSNQERNTLTRVSKEFLKLVEKMPIEENYIFSKLLNGVISTQKPDDGSHYTREELRKVINHLENKNVYLERRQAYCYKNVEKLKADSMGYTLPLIYLVTNVILIIASMASCAEGEMGIDMACLSRLRDPIMGSFILGLSLYGLYFILESPIEAYRQAHSPTETFFDSVAGNTNVR